MNVGAASRSVRVSAETYVVLRELAGKIDTSITGVIDQLVEDERRRQFWKEAKAAYARLKADPEAWAAYQTELRELEGTLMDGIEPEEDWSFLANAKPEEIEFLSAAESSHASTR